jgi:hypothetical protein
MLACFYPRETATRFGFRNQRTTLKDMSETVFVSAISASSLSMVAFDISSIFAWPSTMLSTGEHLLRWNLSSFNAVTSRRPVKFIAAGV